MDADDDDLLGSWCDSLNLNAGDGLNGRGLHSHLPCWILLCSGMEQDLDVVCAHNMVLHIAPES